MKCGIGIKLFTLCLIVCVGYGKDQTRPLDSGIKIEYAQNLTIEPQPWGYLVGIKDPVSGEMSKHNLVDQKETPPAEIGSNFISIPKERIAALSTTYYGPFGALDAIDTIVAVENRALVWSPEIRQHIEEGLIGQVGPSHSIDLEALVYLQPDLVLFSRIDSGQNSPEERLRRLGIPSMVTSAWRENSPLGRAEWIKLFGILMGKEESAVDHFNEVRAEYEKLVKLVADIPASQRPRILASAPYGGTWYLPGGESYTAHLIKDAGGEYLWAHLSGSGSRPIDFEAAFASAFEADIWINPSHHTTLRSLGSLDRRFRNLPIFRAGKIYNHTKQSHEAGANQYWEEASVHPERVLSDLIHIFHPKLEKRRELIYYEQLK